MADTESTGGLGMRDNSSQPSYEIFMLVLCLFALGSLVLMSFTPEQSEIRQVFIFADFFVCAIFFVDFCLSFLKATNRTRYFFTWGWIDLLSSVPGVEALRIGRASRVLRVLRVLRALRATKLIAAAILTRRRQSVLLAAILVTLLLIIVSSTSVLVFEDVEASNIKTAEDAV